jgi:hypothetical protein
MCGSATLAIAVSRSSMKVARVTVMAMNHGLMASCCAGIARSDGAAMESAMVVRKDWMIMRPFGRIYGMLDLGKRQASLECLAEVR